MFFILTLWIDSTETTHCLVLNLNTARVHVRLWISFCLSSFCVTLQLYIIFYAHMYTYIHTMGTRQVRTYMYDQTSGFSTETPEGIRYDNVF